MIEGSIKFPMFIIIPYDVGTARALDDPNRVYNYGMKGIPDVMVIFTDATIKFYDMKTGKSGLNTNQKNFDKRLKEVTNKNLVMPIRSVEEFIEELKNEAVRRSIR